MNSKDRFIRLRIVATMRHCDLMCPSLDSLSLGEERCEYFDEPLWRDLSRKDKAHKRLHVCRKAGGDL